MVNSRSLLNIVTCVSDLDAERTPRVAPPRLVSGDTVSDSNTGPGLLGLFHGAQKRMLVVPRELVHLRDLGFCHLAREDAAHALAAGMDVQHDLCRPLAVESEEHLQHF